MIMTTEQRLKQQCETHGSAIAVSISGDDGAVFIYVTPHCSEKEMMKSLLIAATEIAAHRSE